MANLLCRRYVFSFFHYCVSMSAAFKSNMEQKQERRRVPAHLIGFPNQALIYTLFPQSLTELSN